jgi:mutual gliding-motility protein MglA
MAIFNAKDRIIECKLVYYGPGRCGKTTNLEYVFKAFHKQTDSEMVSINTMGDRTLFFDFLPMGLGKIRGCDVKVQLYTVPGQSRYRSTRKMVLKGVDGVVFVAENLKEEGKSIFNIPLVLQYNKRDLEQQGIPILALETLDRDLNSKLKVPYHLASALKGEGVGGTLKEALLLTLRHLQKELHWTK